MNEAVAAFDQYGINIFVLANGIGSIVLAIATLAAFATIRAAMNDFSASEEAADVVMPGLAAIMVLMFMIWLLS